MIKQHVVVLSVPFLRVAKVILSKYILDYLTTRADVIILSPYDSREFKSQFRNYDNITFQKWVDPTLPVLANSLLATAEIMRMNGYWYKFRNSGMGYYHRNQCRVFKTAAADSHFPLHKRIMFYVLSRLGYFPGMWKLLTGLVVRLYLKEKKINIDERYKRVTVIQSSSWGLQDRLVPFLLTKVRRVLIPYTTDQLTTNGYLLADYDAVCVQGELEWEYAVNKHHKPEDKLFKTGSIWFRILDLALKIPKSGKGKDAKQILYAGVSRDYYPRAGELRSIERILHAIKNNPSLVGTRIVYRPYILDAADMDEIITRFDGEALLSIQWPDQMINQIGNQSNAILADVVDDHVHSLSNFNLMIMSGSTSLALDVSYISNCAVIGNFSDFDGKLNDRRTDLLLSRSGTNLLPGCVIVKSNLELIEQVQRIMLDPDYSKSLGTQLIYDWDYSNVNLTNVLDKAIFEDCI